MNLVTDDKSRTTPAPSRLSVVFVAELARRSGSARTSEIDPILRQAWSEGRTTYPGVEAPASAFAAWLADRVEPDDVCRSLKKLKVADLYLACALAHQNPAAYRAFETLVLEVGSVLRASSNLEPVTDDVLQWLRTHLLIGNSKPAILTYGGRGRLFSWMRVAALREALARIRKAQRELPTSDEALLAMPAVGTNPEILAMRGRYGGVVKEAMAAGLTSLGPDDRHLLRRYYLEGKTIDQLGAELGIHRATAARRVARAKRRLSHEVRAELSRRLSATRWELDSLMTVLRSGLSLSIARHLEEPDAESSGKVVPAPMTWEPFGEIPEEVTSPSFVM